MTEKIVLCHGSRSEIVEFDLAMTSDGCTFGRGFYFTNSLAVGREYSGGMDPYVAIISYENPFVVDYDLPYDQRQETRRFFRPNKTVRDRLIELGHDCVLVRERGYVEMVVLHPEMIENLGRMSSLDKGLCDGDEATNEAEVRP